MDNKRVAVYESEEIIEVCTNEEWKERYQRKLLTLKEAKKERDVYFMKQRLYGLLMLANGLEICYACHRSAMDCTGLYLIGVPLILYGIWCILTQRMHISNEYYIECQCKKRNNKRKQDKLVKGN